MWELGRTLPGRRFFHRDWSNPPPNNLSGTPGGPACKNGGFRPEEMNKGNEGNR